MKQPRLIFVISPPRAGSTLLQRMLGSHSRIFTHPEPHMITPLAYLGYWDTVDKAPYDHINSAEAIRAFVANLPKGEQDYFDAVRAYTDLLYGKMLDTGDRDVFLDKTPAYALVLPFLAKLYPQAHYVVLCRHPLAVMSSYANSFFEGDWEKAHAYNPILHRYVPAMASFLRQPTEHVLQVRYEELVSRPEPELRRIFSFCDLEHEASAVEYRKNFASQLQGPGDPIGVQQHDRPVTSSTDKWAKELAHDAKKLQFAQQIVSKLSSEDLNAWGYPKPELFAPMRGINGAPLVKTKGWNGHQFQRKIMMHLKRNIHHKPLGKVVKKVRYYCDVLLRD